MGSSPTAFGWLCRAFVAWTGLAHWLHRRVGLGDRICRLPGERGRGLSSLLGGGKESGGGVVAAGDFRCGGIASAVGVTADEGEPAMPIKRRTRIDRYRTPDGLASVSSCAGSLPRLWPVLCLALAVSPVFPTAIRMLGGGRLGASLDLSLVVTGCGTVSPANS